MTRKEWVNRQESNRQDSGWVWSRHEGWPSVPITETWEGRKVPPKEGRTEGSPRINQKIDGLTRYLECYPGLGLGYWGPRVWAASVTVEAQQLQSRRRAGGLPGALWSPAPRGRGPRGLGTVTSPVSSSSAQRARLGRRPRIGAHLGPVPFLAALEAGPRRGVLGP